MAAERNVKAVILHAHGYLFAFRACVRATRHVSGRLKVIRSSAENSCNRKFSVNVLELEKTVGNSHAQKQ